MRVLYVNHTAAFSGAEHSLLALLRSLPGGLEPVLGCPPGELSERARAEGILVEQLPGTDGSLRLHPWQTSRAMFELALAAGHLRRMADRLEADLVHANSIRAGLIMALARLAGVPRVTHIRDCLPPALLSRATLGIIARTSELAIANSAHTAASARALAPGLKASVVLNPVDLDRFDGRRLQAGAARKRLGAIAEEGFLLGVVAQISPWKGQDVAIQAVAQARRSGVDARLLLVGEPQFLARSTRYDNRSFQAGLQAQVRALGLERQVAFLGRRDDVPEIMSALDALLAPSWEEPFGRSIAEAMAIGLPVLATARGGPSELIDQGIEGFLLDPHEVTAWSAAIEQLAREPRLADRMGGCARERIRRECAGERHAASIAAHYERLLSEMHSRPVGALAGASSTG